MSKKFLMDRRDAKRKVETFHHHHHQLPYGKSEKEGKKMNRKKMLIFDPHSVCYIYYKCTNWPAVELKENYKVDTHVYIFHPASSS